jgi:hypothetical protein
MKILKTNGKTASKQIHLLADVVMETSLNNSWLLNIPMKKEILLSLENNLWTLEELNQKCEVCLNHTLAVYFALKSWYSGYYGDIKVDFDSIQDYFIGWGESDEI